MLGTSQQLMVLLGLILLNFPLGEKSLRTILHLFKYIDQTIMLATMQIISLIVYLAGC